MAKQQQGGNDRNPQTPALNQPRNPCDSCCFVFQTNHGKKRCSEISELINTEGVDAVYILTTAGYMSAAELIAAHNSAPATNIKIPTTSGLLSLSYFVEACRCVYGRSLLRIVNTDNELLFGYPYALYNIDGTFTGTLISAPDEFADWFSSNYPGYELIATDNPMEWVINNADGMHPTSVAGLNVFQFNITEDRADSVPCPAGGFIVWGDGEITHATGASAPSSTVNLYQVFEENLALFVMNTYSYLEVFPLSNGSYTYVKTYAEKGARTISVCHKGNEDFVFSMDNDSGTPPPLGEHAENLTGYFPKFTRQIEFTSTQNASFNRLAGLKNWADVLPNVVTFRLRTGGLGQVANLNFSTAGIPYNMPNLKCLDMFTFSYFSIATTYTPPQLKYQLGTTNIPAKFPALKNLGFKGDQWTPDLNMGIKNFRLIQCGSYNIGAPGNRMPAGAADIVFPQLNAAKTDTGGQVLFFGPPPTDPVAISAKNDLISKGVTISFY